MTAGPASPLPAQPRRRALAALDAQIAAAGRLRDSYAAWAAALRQRHQNARQMEVLFRLAEHRLAQLQLSRNVLLHGEEGEDGA